MLIGNEEDFSAALDFKVAGLDEDFSELDPASVSSMIERGRSATRTSRWPATTLRNAAPATRNDWGAVCTAGGTFHEARCGADLEIFDRVGGGDSFASGLIYGLLAGKGRQAVDTARRTARWR